MDLYERKKPKICLTARVVFVNIDIIYLILHFEYYVNCFMSSVFIILNSMEVN
jgi:hypothetical protein